MIQLHLQVSCHGLSFMMKSFRVIQEMHPSNNKQSTPLALSVIHEIKTALLEKLFF